MYNVIYAQTFEGGIGMNGDLPWKRLLSTDLKRFNRITTNHTVIMGKNTWLSLNKPLKNRLNIVVTSSNILNVITSNSLEEAIKLSPTGNEIFVIGGSRLINESLKDKNCKIVYLTNVLKQFKCDCFVDKINTNDFNLKYKENVVENDIPYEFIIYERKN